MALSLITNQLDSIESTFIVMLAKKSKNQYTLLGMKLGNHTHNIKNSHIKNYVNKPTRPQSLITKHG